MSHAHDQPEAHDHVGADHRAATDAELNRLATSATNHCLTGYVLGQPCDGRLLHALPQAGHRAGVPGVLPAFLEAKNSDPLAELLPNAQLWICADANDGFLDQYPDLFADHVGAFLNE